MSAQLGVELEPGPIERARADLLIVCFHSTELPLRGAAGRVDWRLCGRLSRLIQAGLLAGHAGEAALLPGGGGVRAPLVLALGLGPLASFGPAALTAFARDAVGRGLALRAPSLALALPGGAAADATALRPRLEAFVAGAAEAVARHPEAASPRLLLVVPREDAGRALEALRAVRPPGLPAGVALRLPGGAPARRQPAAAGHASRSSPFK